MSLIHFLQLELNFLDLCMTTRLCYFEKTHTTINNPRSLRSKELPNTCSELFSSLFFLYGSQVPKFFYMADPWESHVDQHVQVYRFLIVIKWQKHQMQCTYPKWRKQCQHLSPLWHLLRSDSFPLAQNFYKSSWAGNMLLKLGCFYSWLCLCDPRISRHLYLLTTQPSKKDTQI